jgi:hypothetical protein
MLEWIKSELSVTSKVQQLMGSVITHANGANLLESNMLQKLEKITLVSIENSGVIMYGEKVVEVNRLPLSAVVILNPSTSVDSSSLSSTLLTVFKVEAIAGYVLGFGVLVYVGFAFVKSYRTNHDENALLSQSTHVLLPSNNEDI